MRSLITVLSLLCAVITSAAAEPLPAPVAIEIPSAGYVLHAQLYRPSSAGPFPVVIALHGCGGLAGRSDPVLPRYRDWAEELVKDGKAVLLPDSYGSRGLGPQCRVKERRISGRRERVADIVAAQKWLT
ncbi:MAG: dienelactone hydrolase family protein, partial [Bradyrhizobium sp.]|nr:dienelactone hydrolase family protein [Bradyrhizobium sp.]